MRELARLSEIQEEVLSFIHSLIGNKSLASQDSREVSSPKQFPKEKQQRLDFLAYKNIEGTITKEELSEFEKLVDKAQAMMLQNTETLARVIRLDLFDKKGRPIRYLLAQAVRAKAKHKMLVGKDKNNLLNLIS